MTARFPNQRRLLAFPRTLRAMKLYVCWGTFPTLRPGGHPCANGQKALRAAGHEPEVVLSYGLAILPDGTAVAGSKRIVEWARANPA